LGTSENILCTGVYFFQSWRIKGNQQIKTWTVLIGAVVHATTPATLEAETGEWQILSQSTKAGRFYLKIKVKMKGLRHSSSSRVSFFLKEIQYTSFSYILLLYWGYIVTFTKVLTIYHN
jgi:hypothetical protein